jgi:hypothetical protein
VRKAHEKVRERNMFQGQKPEAATSLLEIPPKLGIKSGNSLIYDITRFLCKLKFLNINMAGYGRKRSKSKKKSPCA